MMFKNQLAVIVTLVALLFIGACSSDNPSEQQTADNAAKRQGNNQEKAVIKIEDTQLPKESLQKTDQGETVKMLQDALNEIGYSLDITGDYDEYTTWAITDLQMQQASLTVTGIYDDDTKQKLKELLKNKTSLKPGTKLKKPAKNSQTISNPHEILVLVNKEHALPADFVPLNLVVPDVRFPFEDFLPKKQMRQAAATSLEEMFQAANNAGLELFAQSGYRSYDRQDAIFASNVKHYGEKEANTVSARPGESEHQSGLTMDVTSPDVGYKLLVKFGETDEGKWIKQHAAKYGFIIRYPKGKESITGYQYEPWHLRYVGKEAATEIMEKGITLEEYLGKK